MMKIPLLSTRELSFSRNWWRSMAAKNCQAQTKSLAYDEDTLMSTLELCFSRNWKRSMAAKHCQAQTTKRISIW
jgi:hypothetical protein